MTSPRTPSKPRARSESEQSWSPRARSESDQSHVVIEEPWRRRARSESEQSDADDPWRRRARSESDPSYDGIAIHLNLDMTFTDFEVLQNIYRKVIGIEEKTLLMRMLTNVSAQLADSQEGVAAAVWSDHGSRSSGLGSFTYWRLVAIPSYLRIPRTMLVSSRWGNYLEAKGVLSMVALALVVIFFIMQIAPVQGEDRIGTVKTVRGAVGVTELLAPWWFDGTQILVVLLGGSVIMHRSNRYMLRNLAFTFESMFILGCFTAQDWIIFLHRFIVFDDQHRIYRLCIDALEFVSYLPIYVFLANMDTMRFNRFYKCAFLFIAFVTLAHSAIQNRCVSKRWGETDNCTESLLSSGSGRRELYLACLLQVLVYCLKGFVGYSKHSFIKFSPSFVPELSLTRKLDSDPCRQTCDLSITEANMPRLRNMPSVLSHLDVVDEGEEIDALDTPTCVRDVSLGKGSFSL